MTSHLVEDPTPGAQLLVGGPPYLDGVWILVEPKPIIRVPDATTGKLHTYRKEQITYSAFPVTYIYVHDSLKRSEGIALLQRGYKQPPPATLEDPRTEPVPPPDDALRVLQEMCSIADRELLMAKCHYEEQMRNVGRLMRFDRISRGVAAQELVTKLHITLDHLRDLDMGTRMWTSSLLRDYATFVRDEPPKSIT